MRLGYVHLPRFPIQRKVLERPSLARSAFVLTEEARGARRVVFASGTAMKAGVLPGMTLTASCALVHTLTALPYEPEDEQRAVLSLGEALMTLSPGFEAHPPEGLWLDASAAGLSGSEKEWAARVLDRCAAHGHQAKVAVASNRFVSRALARHSPVASQVISEEDVTAALAPLPLKALEQVSPRTMASLRSLGLSTLGEVAALPPGALNARLGAEGLWIHALCRGEDLTPFSRTETVPLIEEALMLEWPAESMEPLVFALKTVFDRVGGRLAGRQQAAARLTLTLVLDPRGDLPISLALARPSAQPKLLLDLAKHRIADLTVPNPIRQLVVRVDEASEDRAMQRVLGAGPQPEVALEVVLSRLASRLGEGALFSAELEATHRPEQAYAPVGFHPPRLEEGLFRGVAPERVQAPSDHSHLERPARMFSKTAPLDVDVRDGELYAARLLGKRRQAVDVTGPERLQGEWWSPESFARDYYRVIFDGLGPVWVYRDARDGRFYLHGMFD
jgi:protein ImuB